MNSIKFWIWMDGTMVGLPIIIALQLVGMNMWPSSLFGIAAAIAVSAIVRAIRKED